MKKGLLLLTKTLMVLGFTANLASAQTIIMTNGGANSECTGNFYDSGGAAGNYLNGENRTHTICPSTPGAMLQVNFTAFSIESGWDYLSVYNGPNTGSPLVGTYSGTTGPGIVTSTDPSGCLTFVFTSDGSVVMAGWEATIACIGPPAIIMSNGSSSACAGNFYDSGDIGGNYANSENYTHTICPSTPGAMLEVNFTAFNIESGWDNLYIYNGPTTASPLIGTYTGTTGPGTVTSTDPGGCLTFVFTSDGSVVSTGWEATLNCIVPPSDIIMSNGSSSACSVNFYDSGNIGGNYANGENYTHTICPSTPGAMLEVNFTAFNIESGWDNLYIYNGPTTASPLIGTYTGITSPGTVTSTDPGGCLTFVFTSDGSVVSTGWEATVNCISPPDIIMSNGSSSACSGNFYDSGDIGGNYANSESYTHTICPTTPGAMLEVNFTAFNIESGWDNLYIYNGPTTGSPLIGTYTGTTSPGTVTSTDPGGCLTFVFTSDGSVVSTGWEATLNCVAAPPCAEPDVPTLSASATTVCPGGLSTITIGGNLNDATAWSIYEGSCGGTLIGTSATSTFDVNPLVTTTYYIRGEGGCAALGSCGTVAITVDDNTAPVADIATLTDITAECEVTSLTAPTATDNCSGSVTGTHNATLPITSQGTTVVTWSYDDGNGNISTQDQNVMIADVTAPVADIATLADVTAECEVTTLTAPTATDNCSATVTVTNNATLPISASGTTVVTWSYDDGNGNVSTQDQNVVIDDVTAPMADVASLTDVTGACDVTPTAPTATDNCSGSITGVSNVSFPISTAGTTVVTWTYDDGNGNTSTQDQNVIVTGVETGVTQVGATLTAAATGVTYQWIDCDLNMDIAGETSASFTATNLIGNYAVQITDNGCVDTSACFLVDFTGIADLANIGISIYPNPSAGLFTIESLQSLETIQILDVRGRLIYEATSVNESSIAVNISDENAGVYYVRISGTFGTITKKIILQ